VPTAQDLLDGFLYRPDEEVPSTLLLEGELPEAPTAPEEPLADFLSFELAGERYAVPLSSVREILKPAELTEIPRGGPSLLGVMNLRGDIAPIYDLKVKLRLADRSGRYAGPVEEREPVPRSARVLVLSTDQDPLGVWVDRVFGVVRLRPSTIEAPPTGVGGGERDAVTGIGRSDDELYVLLDFGRALA
jgi:purine-binding chemotaxis protein CheW